MKNHAIEFMSLKICYKTNFKMDEITITPCPATQGLNVMFLSFCSRKGYGNYEAVARQIFKGDRPKN